MKILVLGGGAQGRVIASDLAASMAAAQVCVADVRRPELPKLDNLSWIEADLSDGDTIARELREHDLGVCALPSHLGFGALEAAIVAGRSLVDVSFSARDPLVLDRTAARAGVTLAPDCGLAPGISNLVVGRSMSRQPAADEIMIFVGGVAQKPDAPYGYVVTWSLDDLLEEYTRPARIMQKGAVVTVPVFSGMEPLDVPGVGGMEAFFSDGLRSLLHTIPNVPEMGEKTLRWPGHAKAVQPLLEAGTLREELRAKCSSDPRLDLVVLLVRVRRGNHLEEFLLVDRYDERTRRTAMSRTTALTTSAVAQLAAAGGLGEPGVKPLEFVGRDEKAYAFIIGALSAHDVRVVQSER